MTRQARLWTGVTLLMILAINYGIIGFPLYRKAVNLHDKATTMLMKQIKSGSVLKTSAEEDYILEIFRREKASIDQKIFILNSAAITLVILLGSWTAFGILARKKK
ncbi:MAG: hypothetical protein NTW09_04525 [Candidatus Omnitrophica bacterium]|nr:hypothetical protein [Candidatus Omnitrophota bacterium]